MRTIIGEAAITYILIVTFEVSGHKAQLTSDCAQRAAERQSAAISTMRLSVEQTSILIQASLIHFILGCFSNVSSGSYITLLEVF